MAIRAVFQRMLLNPCWRRPSPRTVVRRVALLPRTAWQGVRLSAPGEARSRRQETCLLIAGRRSRASIGTSCRFNRARAPCAKGTDHAERSLDEALGPSGIASRLPLKCRPLQRLPHQRSEAWLPRAVVDAPRLRHRSMTAPLRETRLSSVTPSPARARPVQATRGRSLPSIALSPRAVATVSRKAGGRTKLSRKVGDCRQPGSVPGGPRHKR